jgi:(E)-4-hydroxy-3-methylbut-2-enyl-diphosphate synthase
VNGPGEAREADVGLAGGKGSGVIFRKGKIVRTVGEKGFVRALIEEIKKTD